MAKSETRKYSDLYFAVVGNGTFPIDMLRYDNCTPATEIDSNMVEDTLTWEKHKLEPSIIWLRKLILEPSDPKFRMPTYGRWESFQWKVVPNSERQFRPWDDERKDVADKYTVRIK